MFSMFFVGLIGTMRNFSVISGAGNNLGQHGPHPIRGYFLAEMVGEFPNVIGPSEIDNRPNNIDNIHFISIPEGTGHGPELGRQQCRTFVTNRLGNA